MIDFEFDKEIDTLLRQTAPGEAGFVPSSDSTHLDADELSAFAENALPEKAKQRYLLHLAECDACRKNLSTLITLNAERPIEVVETEEKRFVQTPIPWYRKLFAVPNLAYTLGALVLVFSGIAVYTVLQNAGNSPNAEVSQTYEKQPTGKGMSSDGDATLTDTYSSSNTAASNTMSLNAVASTNSSMNTATGSAANPPSPVAPSTMMNTNAASQREQSDKNSKTELKPAAPNESYAAPETMDSVTAAPPPAKDKTYELDEATKNQPSAQAPIAQSQNGDLPLNGRRAQSALKPMMRAEEKRKALELSKNDDREKEIVGGSISETTVVGGKTFKRTSNAWYDSAYRGQTTVNVSRGTNEYKKLDADLRGVAENLGGTVVIVWKQKAYRIQ